jgi:hypothetical protein
MAGGDAPAFEFLIEAALLAERDDWPPKYSTWRWPARRRADSRPRRPASLGHRVIRTTVAVDSETLLRVIATGAAAPGQTAAGAECHLAGAMESALTLDRRRDEPI